jgi:hypothetical protein
MAEHLKLPNNKVWVTLPRNVGNSFSKVLRENGADKMHEELRKLVPVEDFIKEPNKYLTDSVRHSANDIVKHNEIDLGKVNQQELNHLLKVEPSVTKARKPPIVTQIVRQMGEKEL